MVRDQCITNRLDKDGSRLRKVDARIRGTGFLGKHGSSEPQGSALGSPVRSAMDRRFLGAGMGYRYRTLRTEGVRRF